MKKKKRKVKHKIKKRVRLKHKKLRKKVVFLVIDGLADLPINNKTPLSQARKPNLDYFAKFGMQGEIIPVPRELWSDITQASVSHLGNMTLLGYDVKKLYTKRGPLEAVGTNMPYQEGWLALRCNFATVDKDLTILDRRVARNSFGLDEIARYVNENVNIGAQFLLKRTFEHRVVLIIKEKLSDKISNSDPFVIGEKVKRVEATAKEGEKAARIVQDFIDKARSVIEFNPANEQRIKNGIPPANFLLTREAGNMLPALRQNFVKRNKIKAVCVAENGVMKGTCILAGMDSVTVPELKFDSQLKFIFDNVHNLLAEYDFIYAHIKGVDEAAHDGDFNLKMNMIERIDDYLEDFRDENIVLVVTCDHITSTKNRRHEFGPVPVLISGLGKDRTVKFDEMEAKKGKLGIITGKRLWDIVFRK